jgi:hypothetical protein
MNEISHLKYSPTFFEDMADLIESTWDMGYGSMERKEGWFSLATGGWSENEYIISEMMSNRFWWMNYWRVSKRGGYYEFAKEIIIERSDKELIVDFLDWYYTESAKTPMRFETDHEDIAMMYLQEREKE